MNPLIKKTCVLSFDVEEWFQVENFKAVIQRRNWETINSSVVENTRKILEILEKQKIKGTFFILGWVAKRYPHLIKEIAMLGHEIASHGFGHDLTFALNDDELYADILHSKEILENLIGESISGYRAPSFSVDDRLLSILKDLKFCYDSSYNPFSLNSRYGIINQPMINTGNGLYRIENDFYEIPISSLRVLNFDLPIGGGAYLRISPFLFFKKLVRRNLERCGFYNFYLHPWELEPAQPRVKHIRLNYKFRHYFGLERTQDKFIKFIDYLKSLDCQFKTARECITVFKSG